MLHAYHKISWPQPTDSLPTSLSLGDKFSFPWIFITLHFSCSTCAFPCALFRPHSLSHLSEAREQDRASRIEEGIKTEEQNCGCSPATISASCTLLDWHSVGPGADGYFFQIASLLAFVRARFRAWLGNISGFRKFAFRLGFVGGRDSATEWWWWGIGLFLAHSIRDLQGMGRGAIVSR